jgi:hypothetical protein
VSTELLIPAVDPETGWIDESVIPPVARATGGAMTNEWSWYFPGPLAVRTGLARRTFPAMYDEDGNLMRMQIVGLSALLGTVSSGETGERVRYRILVDGATFWEDNIANGLDRSVTISVPTLPSIGWSQVVSVDVTAIPTNPVQKPGDLTVQLWWRWTSAG